MNRVRTRKLTGQAAIQKLNFSAVPTTGGYTVTVPAIGTTASITSYGTSGLQTALRALAGLSNVTVTIIGSTKFTINFPDAAVGDISIGTNTLATASAVAVTITTATVQAWASGLTAVTSVTADGVQFGDVLILIATAASQQLTDGSNLKLLGNWVSATAGDTLTLVCDGTNWCEVSRSLN